MARGFEEIDDAAMSPGEHIEELRGCLIRALYGVLVGIIACFLLRAQILDLLCRPFIAACIAKGTKYELVTYSPQEAFLTVAKLAVLGGLIVSAPWWIWQLWRFVASGLLRKERRWAGLFAAFGSMCFLGGVYFLYAVILRLCLMFFIVFAGSLSVAVPPETAIATQPASMTIQPMYSLRAYVDLALGLAFAFGIAFMLPVAVLLLAMLDIVSVAGLSRSRRYVIFGAVVLGAILTPPDVVSQLALAGPLVLLYEVGILMARVVERRRRKAALAEGYGDDDYDDSSEGEC